MYKVPKTKRDLYYKLIRYDTGLFGILGTRKVGKTILLKQLANDLNGVYISAEEMLYSPTDLSNKITDKILDAMCSDARVICLDEITFLSHNNIYEIFSKLRDYSYSNKLVFYTGSYPEDIKTIGDSIGRGLLFTLYDLSFSEYCRWNSIESPEMSNVIDYFREGSVGVNKDDLDNSTYLIYYVNSLITCVKNSWTKRINNNFTDEFLQDTNTVKNIINYFRVMSEFSIVKTSKGNKPKSIKNPEQIRDLKSMTQEMVNDFDKTMYCITGDGSPYDENRKLLKRFKLKDLLEIQTFIRCMKLGLPYSDISINDNEFIAEENNKTLISAFPWLLTVFDDNYHEDITPVRISLLLEYYYSLTMIESGYCTGCYRLDNNYEIDIVAVDFCGIRNTIAIECKYQEYSNISDYKFYRYAEVCEQAGLKEYFITCIDKSFDKLVTLKSGYKVIAKVRKIPELLYELSKGIYCSDVYNKNVNSINGETNFDWSTHMNK